MAAHAATPARPVTEQCWRTSEFIGVQTNNYAEYSGMMAVLRWCLANGVKQLRVIADSELMVKQMQGKYKVASPVLRPLFEEARKMARQLTRVEFQHTLRGGNKAADALANAAMDKGMGRAPQPAEASSAPISGGGRPAPSAVYAKAPAKPASFGGQKISPPSNAPQKPAPPKPVAQELDGYVKDGVVHILGGSTLPDGIFVKIVRK